MFGIDFSEILLIFIIALIVLGPTKLPRLAAQIGRWIGRARSMARQFREQWEQEAASIQHAAELRERRADAAKAHSAAEAAAASASASTPTADPPPATPAAATPPAEPAASAPAASAESTPVPESHEPGR